MIHVLILAIRNNSTKLYYTKSNTTHLTTTHIPHHRTRLLPTMILWQTKHIIFILYLSSYNLAVSQVDSCMCVCARTVIFQTIYIFTQHIHHYVSLLHYAHMICITLTYINFIIISYQLFYFYIKENFCQKLVIKILRQFLTCPLTRGHTHHHSLLHFYHNPTYSDREGGVLPNNQEWF